MDKFKRSLFGALLTVMVLVSSTFAGEPVKVKVLVMAMFEIGENTGDFAGEFQHWYEGYLMKNQPYDVLGAPYPLFVADSGVAGIVTGMGKAQAAATLTAILKDPRFDFSDSYFITSGCAGASPERSTLGSVVWCDAAVDYELGHSWKQSDGLPGEPTFMVMDDFRDAGYIPLNRALAQKAYDLTKSVELSDDEKAVAYRALYPQDSANAAPSVQMGVSVTSDAYWHGKASAETADYVCSQYEAGTYMITQMEDSAFAAVLRRFGYLNRYMVLRDVVNFDRPHPGQTVKESLAASSGGFSIGMTNGFKVGSVVVDHILANPGEWKDI